jgi:hypothetical protein
MTTSHVRRMLLCFSGFMAASLVSVTWAKDDLPRAVRDVLSEESRLNRSDWNRRRQLGEELVKAKSSAEELRWHAGFVKLNGTWLPFEESISPEPAAGKRREYLDRRSQAEQSPKLQADLAMWCGQHGMVEQSLAHNYRAIMLTPTDQDVSELYRRMRYVRAGTSWLSPYDANDVKFEARQYADRLEQWSPACQRLAEELESGRLSESVRRHRLSVFAADERIPALESVLATHSEVSALAAVEAIEQVPTYRATQALGRLAVFSPWLFVRDGAIAGLKSRRLEDYIPQWLRLARAPVRTEFQRLSSGWDLGFYFQIAEERESEIRVANTTILAPGASLIRLPRDGTPLPIGPQQEEYLRQLSQRLISIDEWMKWTADVSNLETEVVNERLLAAIQETVGRSAGGSPQEWWNWWNVQSGFERVVAKRVVIVSEETETLPPAPLSCLVAGTPIWTERGLVAVERIQPGDRVLSKNVESGELTYKVVLHTTVREPFPVTKFAIGDEAIQATEGHRFWVSGRGWTKTRELAAEQPLHTATGVTRVAATNSAEPAPTYNLVVADFHTYFVGKGAILSHDVLPPKPTNKTVPGLDELTTRSD